MSGWSVFLAISPVLAIFLLLVLLAPAKRMCLHCQRAVPKVETICRYCQHSLEISPSEQATVMQAVRQNAEDLAGLA